MGQARANVLGAIIPAERATVSVRAGNDDIYVTEGCAAQEAGLYLTIIASAIALFIHLNFKAVIGLVRNNIDNTRHGVRTVNGRRTVGDDIHTLHRHRREQLLYIAFNDTFTVN